MASNLSDVTENVFGERSNNDFIRASKGVNVRNCLYRFRGIDNRNKMLIH